VATIADSLSSETGMTKSEARPAWLIRVAAAVANEGTIDEDYYVKYHFLIY
jgi:hypothetical protein